VDEVTPASTESFESVQERIRKILENQGEGGFAKALMDSLRTSSGTTVFEDSIEAALSPARTPADVFQEAQAMPSPGEKIDAFRKLIQRFPHDRMAVQAEFMVGFTYAEELGDYSSARTAFQEFLQHNPDADLAPSAKWMLENMDKPAPNFGGIADSLGVPGSPGGAPKE
jgi:hypothetical protein